MKNYLEYLKDEKFQECSNETEEDAIKRAESIYDRLDEMIERRKLVMKNGKETIELIDKINTKFKEIVKSCENDEIHLEKANDELINKLIGLEERKRIRDTKVYQEKVEIINDRSKKKIQELERNLTKNKKLERVKQTNNSINYEEILKIEEWTQMKIGNIIFDSNVDNWNEGTSVFDQKVINKSNLIFLVEVTDGNKFGGYVNAKIDKVGSYKDYYFINDPNSFLFSLKPNGLMKFDVQNQQYSFNLGDRSSDYLFKFGFGTIQVKGYDFRGEKRLVQRDIHDLHVFKENNKERSYCKNYGLTPKRITAIQLI